jgi:predicted dienelactone hydrolase
MISRLLGNRGQTLPLTLVYPTTEKIERIQRGPFALDVALDAQPQQGNRRLIVMSHGSAGSSFNDFQLASTFARSGYIVVQPLHTGDNSKDSSKAGPESFKTRPLEVTKAIQTMIADSQFGSLFDATKIGVHGMSAGGATALTFAGAQWSMLTMIQHCGKHLDEDIGFCLSGVGSDKTAAAKRRSQFQLGSMTPVAFLPADIKSLSVTPSDPRIRAVSVSVPVAAIFTADSLSKINTPVAVLGAANDEWLLPKFHSDYVMKHCKTCVNLGLLPKATHMDLVAPWPAELAKSIAEKATRGGLPNPAFDVKERQAGFERLVQFYNQQLL